MSGASTLEVVLADLDAESARLGAVVRDADLRTPTPAAGWSVGAQVAHLAWTDTAATYAARAAATAARSWVRRDPISMQGRSPATQVIRDAAEAIAESWL